VKFGYSGPFQASTRGLVPATKFQRTVQDDPTNDVNTALATGQGVIIVPVNLEPGSTYARFALFDTETDGHDNLDLYVFNSNGDFLGSSVKARTAEELSLVNPAPGQYLLVVHGLETDGPDASFTLFSWALGNAAAGNMAVIAPSQAQLSGV
jgi:hypothetical protein